MVLEGRTGELRSLDPRPTGEVAACPGPPADVRRLDSQEGRKWTPSF
ncbi:rCG33425, isoform CRA_c [Rattus norvegicus]|uniref:RCG33425, isoform CRA_c n=1 Tax=Rattus norvegicus TaxID=10116 RepID=A6HEF2_RAT|nr:rCG33425, isoform CRA_c [Rattus norvegicus]EDM04407.1 rCG33425, isoform CRA_c [Rattus norvegicus]